VAGRSTETLVFQIFLPARKFIRRNTLLIIRATYQVDFDKSKSIEIVVVDEDVDECCTKRESLGAVYTLSRRAPLFCTYNSITYVAALNQG
jgi:hypothetical protein